MRDYVEVWGVNGPSLVPLPDSGALSAGRSPENDVVVDDPEVSRLHASLVHLAGGWCVRDLTSRNGTFVNGERARGDRPLRDGDEIRLGRVRLVVRLPSQAPDPAATATAEPVPALTRREQEVLRALFLSRQPGEVVTEPASTREMAAALFVSEAAVKQHLGNLYDKFGIYEGDRRRARLANEALRRGAVQLSEVQEMNEARKRPGRP